jgi:hypothetical protein
MWAKLPLLFEGVQQSQLTHACAFIITSPLQQNRRKPFCVSQQGYAMKYLSPIYGQKLRLMVTAGWLSVGAEV